MSTIRRIEAYVDDEQTPLGVVSQPPYQLQMDATGLAEGQHTLRLVAVCSEGEEHERTLHFATDHFPCEIEGLTDGARVDGRIEFELKPRIPVIPPRAGTRRLDKVILWLAVASLIGAWLWLILGTSSHHAASVPSGLTSAAARGNNAPSAKLMAKGRSVYAQQCAGCHQVSGKGVPGAFPPLANNPNLQDVDLVIDSVVRGKSGPVTVEGGRYDSTMPAFGDRLSNTEIAAVVTFTRNALGNHYGGTDPGQVASRR